MKAHSKTVSFRADQDLLKRIDKESSQFDLSRGAWVRGIITSHVFRDQEPREAEIPDELQRSIDETRLQLEELKLTLAKATLIILSKVGDIPTDEAREIVRSKLLKQEETKC